MATKFSVTPIIKRQLSTLTDQRDPRRNPRVLDYMIFFGIPLGLGLFGFFAGFRLRGVEGILSGVSIFTALLFGLLIHVFTLGLRLTDDPRVSRDNKTAKLIDELQGNVAYAVLIGITSTAVLIVAVSTTIKDRPLGTLISAIAITTISHLLMTILMALKRTQSAYDQFRK